MGAWVLAQACEVARALRHRSDAVTVSTNVSARQLQRPDFPEIVARSAREAGVDPSRLCLEVAESALLDDLDTVTEALRALKDVGVQLAIDDFGTGVRRSRTCASSRSTSSRSIACSWKAWVAARPTTRSSPPPSTWPTRSTWW
jgi:predicted signal transduction protein with EAL and GGDEF domain